MKPGSVPEQLVVTLGPPAQVCMVFLQFALRLALFVALPEGLPGRWWSCTPSKQPACLTFELLLRVSLAAGIDDFIVQLAEGLYGAESRRWAAAGVTDSSGEAT